MLLQRFKRIDFYKTLFEQQGIPHLYSKISPKIGSKESQLPYKLLKNDTKKKNFIVEYFPSYLFSDTNKSYQFTSVFQKKGYAVDLKAFNSFEEYFTAHITKNKRKVIRRSVQRLESCFDVSYKMYYGHIEKDNYEYLIDSLFHMIRERFKTKYARNKDLEQQLYFKKLFYPLILKKQASLFVIYDGSKPIEISLNFNFETICYSAISSFDLDYSKFSLGQIEIYQQLKWYFENKHLIFDLGYGDLPYKKTWSNLNYDFESHLFTKQTPNYVTLSLFKLKYTLINFIIKKNINTLYYKIKNIFNSFSIKKEKYKYQLLQTKTYGASELEYLEAISDIQSDQHDNVRKHIYDLIYSQKVRMGKVKVYFTPSNDYLVQCNNDCYELVKTKM